MSTTPKISIIIISYNEKEYLMQAVDSCLAQIGDFILEIIIIDDGSDDGSIDLIKKIADNHRDICKYYIVEREPNLVDVIPSLRVSNNIKKGIELSNGDYLSILSADDYFVDNTKFKKQVEWLEVHPECVSTYMDFKKVWNDGKTEICRSYGINNQNFLWSKEYDHISSFIFRRICTENLLDRFCDDMGMAYSIFQSGKIHYIEGVSFAYRQRGTSIMHSDDQMALHITELGIYQDIANNGKISDYTRSKFSLSLYYVWKHRSMIGDKYKKYIENYSKYDNDFLKAIIDYDHSTVSAKISIRGQIYRSMICRCSHAVIIRILSLFKS